MEHRLQVKNKLTLIKHLPTFSPTPVSPQHDTCPVCRKSLCGQNTATNPPELSGMNFTSSSSSSASSSSSTPQSSSSASNENSTDNS